MHTSNSLFERFWIVYMFKKKKHAKIQLPPGSLASRIRKVTKYADLRIRTLNAQLTQHLAFPTRFLCFYASTTSGGVNREQWGRRPNRVPSRRVHIWLFVYKYRRHDRQAQVHMHNMAINMHRCASEQSSMIMRWHIKQKIVVRRRSVYPGLLWALWVLALIL